MRWWRDDERDDPIERFRMRCLDDSHPGRGADETQGWRRALRSVERAIEEAARAEKDAATGSSR